MFGSELDAHNSVVGKTRELLNKVVKVFPPKDSHTTMSFREPGGTVDIGSSSEWGAVAKQLKLE